MAKLEAVQNHVAVIRDGLLLESQEPQQVRNSLVELL